MSVRLCVRSVSAALAMVATVPELVRHMYQHHYTLEHSIELQRTQRMPSWQGTVRTTHHSLLPQTHISTHTSHIRTLTNMLICIHVQYFPRRSQHYTPPVRHIYTIIYIGTMKAFCRRMASDHIAHCGWDAEHREDEFPLGFDHSEAPVVFARSTL